MREELSQRLGLSEARVQVIILTNLEFIISLFFVYLHYSPKNNNNVVNNNLYPHIKYYALGSATQCLIY